jgi:Ca2+-binding EF-hand superfamily protein
MLFLPLFALAAATAPTTQAAPKPAGPPTIPRAAFIDNMNGDFAKMDANHDGMLSKQEIENWQRANAMQEIMARNHAIFLQLDTNHDGQLSPQEFAQFHGDPPPSNAAPMISHFDTNHDGVISIVEFRAGTLANFDRLDTNKDGVVDPAEMKAGGIGPH